MLRVKPLLAKKALESRIKTCHSPRILHLATHGFFLQNQTHSPQETVDPQALNDRNGGAAYVRLADPESKNPLLRSGLSLAGANTWLAEGNLPPEAEDGILTAEDVSGLDLLGTELVVLSACETGLGEVHVGEGVFGLRRAFVLAGARTLVMSLWKVSDLSTAMLMQRFYENLLYRNLDRDESLREAQFYIRDLTVGEIRAQWLHTEAIELLAAGDKRIASYYQRLARKPDEYRPFEEPYYWGGFICQGSTKPMAPC
jgi:CHAT domain-containing protein